MLSKKNKTKKNKTKKNKTKKNKTKKNKTKKNKTKKNKYNQIGKGKSTQSKRSIAQKSIAQKSIAKSKSTLKQHGRYDQKNVFQHLLERVCGKRPKDKCRISFIEQNKGCLGINWGGSTSKTTMGEVYLENFGRPIEEFGLSCKLPKGIDAMYDRDRYLHFDFNLGKYCCKPEPPNREDAKQWILKYGLPRVDQLGLEYQELVDLNSFIEQPPLFENKRLTARMEKLKSEFERFNRFFDKLKKFSGEFGASEDFKEFETQFFGYFEDEYQNIYNNIKAVLLPNFK